jgi:putative transposase
MGANMTLFKGKYRVESTRLRGWDYASAGWYFVTVCTRGRECFFGNVVDREMRLSPIGEIVAAEWQKTAEIRPNVKIDAWVVMPNHIHGIIVTQNNPVETTCRVVSTKTPTRLRANSLSAIVGQIKSVCTKRIWAMGFSNFAWQTRFYDHIIRDEESLNRIREYIINNPLNWERDKENPAGLHM